MIDFPDNPSTNDVFATAAQGAKADLAVQKTPSDAFPVDGIRCITQAEYNDLGGSVNANTIYIIVA